MSSTAGSQSTFLFPLGLPSRARLGIGNAYFALVALSGRTSGSFMSTDSTTGAEAPRVNARWTKRNHTAAVKVRQLDRISPFSVYPSSSCTLIVSCSRSRLAASNLRTRKAIAWCPWQSSLLATGGGTNDHTIHFWFVFQTPVPLPLPSSSSLLKLTVAPRCCFCSHPPLASHLKVLHDRLPDLLPPDPLSSHRSHLLPPLERDSLLPRLPGQQHLPLVLPVPPASVGGERARQQSAGFGVESRREYGRDVCER
jgi:hypothetical protein